ncbi:unnamed protein product [Euphydryas editha]|uniref:Uncharacterized protein n=1 Tax=Euphydryas editha TaxID=104508 RepID=A0AAU9UC36_EUPED|nr:unnamed protein product [Euphydryas editha]
MNNTEKNLTEMVTKSRNKALSCSTPEHHPIFVDRSSLDSPSRDSDSDAASPVPFLCTQDGAEGETDVVWNFYTPKSGATKSNAKNTTPVSRRVRKSERLKNIEKQEPKRRIVKPLLKRTEFFQELIELNHDLHEFVEKNTTKKVEKPQSEDDIFSDGSDSSPRSGLKSKNGCLRKNVLSSKILKTESESGLESDDSMNEYLLKASQAVEEKILNCKPVEAKRSCIALVDKSLKPSLHVSINQDSMDAILNNIKIDSPSIGKVKRCHTPKLNNDSFDNLLGNLNDSTLESLSQFPVQINPIKETYDKKDISQSTKDPKVKYESPSSKTIFGRHSSMPESPSINNSNKPSTSGMAFNRYSSMPFNKIPEDSPIRCTPEEIRIKHQQAREKLLAKRALPFTHAQQINQTKPTQPPQKFIPKKPVVQPKVPIVTYNVDYKKNTESINKITTDQNIKQLIEKKRQEALMKLRRKHSQKKN